MRRRDDRTWVNPYRSERMPGGSVLASCENGGRMAQLYPIVPGPKTAAPSAYVPGLPGFADRDERC
jgi:hypothetical protein